MGIADELRRLYELHRDGALTDEEYARAKAIALREVSATPPDQDAAITADVDDSKLARRPPDGAFAEKSPSNSLPPVNPSGRRQTSFDSLLSIMELFTFLVFGGGVLLFVIGESINSFSGRLLMLFGVVCMLTSVAAASALALAQSDDTPHGDHGLETDASRTRCIRCGQPLPADVDRCPLCE